MKPRLDKSLFTGPHIENYSEMDFMNRLLLGNLIVALFALQGSAQEAASSPLPPLMAEMTSNGIAVVPTVKSKLPPPLFGLNTTIDQRKTSLEKLAASHGWQRFSRRSHAAPVSVDLEYIYNASGGRVGHRIYSAFVAYSPLDALKNEDLLESLVAAGEDEDSQPIGFEPTAIPNEILAKVGIDPLDDKLVRYSTIYLPLMNRVALRGTARIEKHETPDSILIAWQLDQRFTFSSGQQIEESIQPYSNHYVKTSRDDLGRRVESPAVPYCGCGGYMSVQKTGLDADQLLVESRMVLHEPDDWFAGSNTLRSKLPAALQENAQTFRRKLQKPSGN